MYIHVAERRSVTHTNYYVTPKERRELISECGPHGLCLFEYFLYLAKQTNNEERITDERISHWFGWNVHTSGRYRRLLKKHGWFHVVKPPAKGSTKVEVYYLGKKAVAEAKGSQEDVESTSAPLHLKVA